MLTFRDEQVLEFLKEYKIARTTTLCKILFPSLRVAQRRLKILYEDKRIKRDQDEAGEHIYYIKKPKQLLHSILVTEFYRYLVEHYEVEKFKIEVDLKTLRPDAMFIYQKNGKRFLGCLEVEISNNGLDINKYNSFEGKVLPEIWIVEKKKQEKKLGYKNFYVEKKLLN